MISFKRITSHHNHKMHIETVQTGLFTGKLVLKMTDPKHFCVICSKKSEQLISSTSDTLNECQTVWKIRKENDLSMSDVRLPENISFASKYHSKCYRQFTTLSKKYRKPKEIDFSETSDLPKFVV